MSDIYIDNNPHPEEADKLFKAVCSTDSSITFRVFWHATQDVVNAPRYTRGIQELVETLVKKIDEGGCRPVIHVVCGNERQRKLYMRNPPARFLRYFDSSIWHFFCVWNDKDIEASKEQLESVLKDIKRYKDEGRYNLKITQEYRNLQQRLLKNAWIEQIGAADDTSHALLSPFLFHSETENKVRLICPSEEDEKVFYRAFRDRIKWRILLVDDCDGKEDHFLSNVDNRATAKRISKLDVITSDFELLNSILPQGYTFEYELETASTLEKAEECLNESIYDLILLDYKLSESTYGYQLLNNIKKNIQCLREKASPNGKFYFMFISAYTYAVQERLRCEDISVSEKYWFIGRGACPTNTPYLFLYCLRRMLNHRYDSLVKHQTMINDSFSINSSEPIVATTLISYLKFIFSKDRSISGDSIRVKCRRGFNALLSMRMTYDTIKSDMKSPLIRSMFPDGPCYNNAFWEHLQNLIYLIAYGSRRQWPEMWEEYIFVIQRLQKAEANELDTTELPTELIKEYLLELKRIQ